MRMSYIVSTSTSTVPINTSTSTSTMSNIPINIEPQKPLYNNEQENISIKVLHCCENCPNRSTKDNPIRVCVSAFYQV